MKLKILVFGQLEEVVGQKLIELEAGNDTATLKQRLLLEFPGLSKEVFRIAVNSEIISGDISLPPDATIALLPPFSGG